MVNVKGRWAFITGAARGIGYLVAQFMAKQGCNLILHGRTKEHCQKVVEEVKALGVEAYAVAAELSDPKAVEAMLQEIDALGVDVDILLNILSEHGGNILCLSRCGEQMLPVRNLMLIKELLNLLPYPDPVSRRGFGIY